MQWIKFEERCFVLLSSEVWLRPGIIQQSVDKTNFADEIKAKILKCLNKIFLRGQTS